VLYTPGQPDAERVLTPRYRLELIDRGMAIGDAAKPLFALDWPNLLHRDLEELRQELGVEPLREGPGSWYSRPDLMAALG
jgi:ubiquinone biosynthesis protein COQ4